MLTASVSLLALLASQAAPTESEPPPPASLDAAPSEAEAPDDKPQPDAGKANDDVGKETVGAETVGKESVDKEAVGKESVDKEAVDDDGPLLLELAVSAGVGLGIGLSGGLLAVPITVVAFPLIVVGLASLFVPGLIMVAVYLAGGAAFAGLLAGLAFLLLRVFGLHRSPMLGLVGGALLSFVLALGVLSPVGAVAGITLGFGVLSSLNLTNIQGLPADQNALILYLVLSVGTLAGVLALGTMAATTAGAATGAGLGHFFGSFFETAPLLGTGSDPEPEPPLDEEPPAPPPQLSLAWDAE